ncbi:MAG: glutamyl-tRNA reductase [Bernardetiaceae bacterium]|nr:glutamyl-tRNA reductase [Bernardetiaceae bacterium]
MNWKVIYISHKTAPIEVRERFALDEMQCERLMLDLKDNHQIEEALVVSTCNRTEIYYNANQNILNSVVALLHQYKNIETECAHHFAYLEESAQAIMRLFRVAVGLESRVVGDLQISFQIKQAYQLSKELAMAGAFLHKLMRSISHANKRAAKETEFRDGAASVSYVTADILRALIQNIENAKILVLGVGAIGTDTVRHLHKMKIKNVSICNRTFSKAAMLASEHAYEVIDFENVEQAMLDADVIISSIATKEAFITPQKLATIAPYRYKFIFDLSVPRSVSTEWSDMPQVVLYNIDDIRNHSAETMAKRKAAIPQVENIILDAFAEFITWTEELILHDAIRQLKARLEHIRKEELARYQGKIKSEESELLEKATENIIQKILKMPAVNLKAACHSGDATPLVAILDSLFAPAKEATA